MREAAITLLALACKWILDTENEWFHDDPYHIDDPTISYALDDTELKKAEPMRPAGVCEAGLDDGRCGGTRATDAEPMRPSGARKAEVKRDAPGATALRPYGP